MLLHHGMFSFGICVMLYFGGSIFTMTYLTLLADMSNTCNHIRVAISSFDCQHTLTYKLNGLAFAINFFVFRVIILSYVVFTKTVFSIPGFKSLDLTAGLNFFELAFLRLN